MTAVAERLAARQRLRGVLTRLPAQPDLVVATAVAGLDFLVLDLIDGPMDELALVAQVRSAHAAGLLVLVSVDNPAALPRLARLGVDAAVLPTPAMVDAGSGIDGAPAGLALIDAARLTVVADPRAHSETAFTAVDLAAAEREILRTFGAAPPRSAEPVVLLAGQLGDVSLWDDVVPELPDDRRYIALRIDLDDSIEGIAETVLATAPGRFALAGHSLGGIVALQICRAAPERVTRLALFNSSGRGASPTQLQVWAEQQDEIEAGRFPELVEALADVNLSPVHPARERNRQRWRQMAKIVGPDGLRRQLTAQAVRPDSLPTLAALTLPVLVVSGAADTVCRPELQAELAAALPNAQHVTLQGAGHMSPLEAPAAVAVLLTRWLVD